MADNYRNATGSIRPVGIVMEPTEVDEAKGVTIRRTVGSERLVLLDPILLLDHLRVKPTEGTTLVGFPRHPHRGIETLTYVFYGRVHHKDSLGNNSSVGSGGSQWMNAGGGIFHEEMLEITPQSPEGVEGLQIWFNVPAADKMKRPDYRPANDEDIPTVAFDGGATAKVVAGKINGVRGIFTDIGVRPTYLAVEVPAGASLSLPAPAGETTFAYLYRGSATFGTGDDPRTVQSPRLVIFGDGDSIEVTTGPNEPAQFIFVSARPLREPVLQYRSLVMNTVDQMGQALKDLEQGTFTQE